MSGDYKPVVRAADPWHQLRQLTTARIGLGRAGVSHTTSDVLQLALAHALARDAVHEKLDATVLCQALKAEGFESIQVASQAVDRETYLSRPDLGRLLSSDSANLLHRIAPTNNNQPVSLTVVIADGLSARAVQEQAVPLLRSLRESLATTLAKRWFAGPIVIASQARVALGDEVAVRLHASMVLVMIGERPGLSSPDSMGIYLTYAPHSGIADSRRNCVSNIRPEGLSIEAAVARAVWLVEAAESARVTGIALKDRSGDISDPRLNSPSR